MSKQMPIDKITVKKVTDYIGITRNTFYYHYQDIYALLEEIVVTNAKKLFVLDEETIWRARGRVTCVSWDSMERRTKTL